MRIRKLFAVTMILFMVSSGCELLGGFLPDRTPRPEVPDPEIVPFTAIPRPFSDSVYFLYGARLADGPVPVLQELLDHDFRLQDAWYPETALCMAPLLDELIVQLKAPDQSIYELGFTSDSSEAFVGCFATWRHYKFED